MAEESPALLISPDQYSMRLPAGIIPQEVSFDILDPDGEPQSWTVSESLPWFTPDSSSGAAGTPLTGTISIGNLPNGNYSGTFSVSSGGATAQTSLSFSIYLPDLKMLVRDPIRPAIIYGLHRGNRGVSEGQVLAIDAATATITSVVDLAKYAYDFSVDPSGSRLYVATPNDPSIQVIGLNSFELLPSLAATTGIYGVSADNRERLVIYRPVGDQDNTLSLADAKTGAILGSANGYTTNNTILLGQIDGVRNQYHAKASDNRSVMIFDLSTDQPQLVKTVTTGSSGRPFFSSDGSRMFLGTSTFTPDAELVRRLNGYPLATDSSGAVVITRNDLRWADSGLVIDPQPDDASLAAISSDDRHAIIWNSSFYTLSTLDLGSLVSLPGPRPQPGETRPAGQPLELSWPEMSGAIGYRVFLGNTEASVSNATSGSTFELGQTVTNTLSLAALDSGFRWFWRVDALTLGGTKKGEVWQFDIPLEELAPAVEADHSPNGVGSLHASANGLTRGLPGDGWSAIFQYGPEGQPVLTQEIQTNPSAYQPTPVPVMGDRWLAIGDITHNETSNSSGGLFLHEFQNGRWQWQRTLTPQTDPDRSYLGRAAAADGSLMLVGMPASPGYGERGRVVAYREWPDFAPTQEFKPSDGAADDSFGAAIAMQGNRAIIGAPADFIRQGRAYIYEFSPTSESWEKRATLLPDPPYPTSHGSSVALDGDTVAIGSINDELLNQVFVFTRSSNGRWTRTATINDPTELAAARWFGSSLAISGDTLFIGAFGDQTGGTDGKVHIYHRNGSSWLPGAVVPNPTNQWGFGETIAVRDGVLYVSSNKFLHSYRIGGIPNHSPRFTSDPPLQFVQGRPVELMISASDLDGQEGLSFHPESLPIGLHLEDLGAGRAKLVGTPTGAAGSATFARWRVEDSQGGRAWQGAKVSLLSESDGPAFTVTPLPEEATAGSDVLLTASVSGAGPFLWQWRKDGVDIPGASGPELNLLELSPADAGSYTVIVANIIGEVESTPATITILPAGPNAGNWPTFGGNTSHSGRHAAALDGHRFTPAWSTPIRGGQALQRAVIADDKVWVTPFSATTGLPQAAAFDLATGTSLWEYDSERSESINPPAWHQGKIYYQLNRALVCLDAATGSRDWQVPFDAPFESHESPTVTSDGIFIKGGRSGGIYRFDFDGSPTFFHPLPQTSGWTPALDRGRLFTCVKGTFIEHSLHDGSAIWSLPDTGGTSYVGIRGDAGVVVGSELACIDLAQRKVLWKVAGDFGTQAATSADTAYVTQGDSVLSFALADGSPELVFQSSAGAIHSDRLIGQPILMNDRLIISNRSHTWIFNRADGTLLQTLDAGGRLSYSNRHLLIAGDDGMLRCFFANATPTFTGNIPENVNAGLAATNVEIHLSDFATDPDEADSSTWAIESNSNPTLFRSLEISPESGDLSVIYNPWISGDSDVVITLTDSAGNVIRQSIHFTLPDLIGPELQVSATITLNRQTGLYEHRITVTNAAAREIAGFDLAITDLPAGISVNNASSTGGNTWTIHHRQPLAAGASVTLLAEYYAPVRGTVIEPVVDVALVGAPEVDPAAEVPGLAVDRCEVLPDGALMIEFTSIPGQFYEVQYSDDAIAWKTSPVTIRAAGNRVQWIDRGPPRTDSLPSGKTSRFYRVLELSTP